MLHYLPVIIPYVLCVLLHKLLLLVVIIILRVLARDVSNRQIHTPFINALKAKIQKELESTGYDGTIAKDETANIKKNYSSKQMYY